MNKFKGLSLILCICVIVSSLSIFAHAIDIEIDLSDLFTPSTDGDSGDSGNTGDSDNDDGKDSGKKPGGVTVVDKTSDDKDSGKKHGDVTVVDKTSDDKQGEEDKEEPKEEVVYNSTFSDVTEDKWFYSYVTELASKGIVEGYPEGDFKPQNNVTRAEFIKLLVVCMDYDTNALPTFDDVAEKDWYYTYVSTAVKNGIISKEEYGSNLKPNEVITRAEAAKLLVKAAKLDTGKYQTPYKDSDDKYVVALYTICLMQGEVDTATGDRYFKPKTGITRAETSTVFSRLLQYNAAPEKYVEEKMEEYGLEELKLLMADAQSFNSEIYGIGLNPMSFYLYTLDNYRSHDDFSNAFLSSYEHAFSHLPEYFTFTDLDISKTADGQNTLVTLQLKSTSDVFSLQDLHDMTNLSFIKARETINRLFGSTDISSLSDLEKLDIIYTYLTENITYPEHGTERDIDYTAMGVFSNGIGTCQGISAAFNILCRTAGLDACAVSFNNHSFNCVLTGGEYLFFDSTHEITSAEYSSDSKNDRKYNCFALSHEKIKNIHGNFPLPLAFWCTLE